jgi:magnesium transporter
MLNIFTLANGRLFQEEIESLEELSRFQPIWVDLESPTVDEKRWIKQYYGLSIPEDAMDEDIEESARFYEEDNGELHIRSDFLIADEDEPRTVRCAFILNQHNADLKSRGVLFSIHDEDVPVFRLLRLRARRAPGLLEDAKEVLLKLFDADAEYSADTLEGHLRPARKSRQTSLVGRCDRRHGRRSAGRHCPAGRLERAHPPQCDGHTPRGEFHDALEDAQCRAV